MWNMRSPVCLTGQLLDFHFHNLGACQRLFCEKCQSLNVHLFLSVFVCVSRVSVLVFSSCYMAFKIVALEHRLNSLVSIGEHIRNE